MPTVYCVAPVEFEAVRLVVQIAAPVPVPAEISPSCRLEQFGKERPVSRLTNVTRALRTSPGNGSNAESSGTEEMSCTAAESVTAAVLLLVDAVQKSVLPL